MVYGQVPFHDDNIIALYEKICTQDLVFPKGLNISSELKDLITKMLVKGGLISEGIVKSFGYSIRLTKWMFTKFGLLKFPDIWNFFCGLTEYHKI